MLYADLAPVVQSRDLRALVKRCEQSEDGRASHFHVMRDLETEFYGRGGLSACVKNINSRTCPRKQDPQPFFDDV